MEPLVCGVGGVVAVAEVVVHVWLPCRVSTGAVCHPSVLETMLFEIGAFGGPRPWENHGRLASVLLLLLAQGPLPSEGAGTFLALCGHSLESVAWLTR